MIVIAAALLMGGTSLASAKNKGAAAHSKPSRPSVNEVTPRPGINEVAPRSTVPDPYYRLSDSYYGSDLYRGLFDFYAMPPYSPGNAYRYMRPVGRP
jgi:hypothetical protein